jgi:glycosyltransferase involved in cell wall biosynthesis
MKISVVVPCYNEEKVIDDFYTETKDILSGLVNSGKISAFEFVFVNDGSKDMTLDIVKSLSEVDSGVRFISFSRNFGKEAAIFAGLKYSSGDYVVIMDADLQDPPSFIPQMLEVVMTGEYDCAGARRNSRVGEPVIRSLFSRTFYKLMAKISDVEILDGARDFRLMTRRYVDALLDLSERNRFSKGLFPWVGFKTKWFDYENVERKAGDTKWSFWKLFSYSIDGIVSFSNAPLVLVSLLGLLFCLFAFGLLLYFLLQKLIGGIDIQGYAAMICIILFLGGVQLFGIGILGQYIAKIFIEVKKRPLYIVSESSRGDKNE